MVVPRRNWGAGWTSAGGYGKFQAGEGAIGQDKRIRRGGFSARGGGRGGPPAFSHPGDSKSSAGFGMPLMPSTGRAQVTKLTREQRATVATLKAARALNRRSWLKGAAAAGVAAAMGPRIV